MNKVQHPAKVKTTLDRYLLALKQSNIPIQKAILFGSYARGNSHDWSDIDVALVSDIFIGNRIDDKASVPLPSPSAVNLKSSPSLPKTSPHKTRS